MVDNRLWIEDEDEDDEEEDGGGFSSKPRVSVERNRRSLKLSFSFIADGLSPKSKSLYTKLPSQPLNLSVLKLDGSSFNIEVTKTATIAELKEAVEAVFDHMPQKGPGKISWPHLWGHFCLCYDGQKLVTEADPIRNYGIKDGDQDFMYFLEFKKLGHNEIDITDVQVWSLSQSNSCEEGEQKDKEDGDCSDIEKGKLQHYDKDRCLIKPRKARIAHLLGGWFLCTRQATVKRKKLVGLACPSGMGTGLVGGFRKIIWFCRKKRNSRRDKWRED
ncbi:u11/u12 small nuclear ribonucleoprotein 25 kda protein [Quercus suber]|uniref:U11/u12 small nuclear ribonucleoprotein 25 kDa protein n=1 Tax=Quercus suber TaxID=58331 RepID=A0AAW0K7B3_QUESU